ncbi:hypothetical protein BC6307_13170 [Sutcliffiella cohnii]|uniref:Uncharacterized protein n=1 Tax=Sutcliffiella cohnii TaxID=33932 RepID=A0A223KXY1_9BACI|nr:hypothetical protein BC6307_13170 [Sutcliffiella cohnii]
MYVDSSGRKGIGETPQCEARGGSPAARGKRSIFPERLISTLLFCSSFILIKIVMSQPLIFILS